MIVPEQYEGLGLGMLEAALVQEALGGSVAPAAFLARTLATIGIAAAGTEKQKSEYLPRIAAGEIRFGVALTERVGKRDGAGITADNGQLSGIALFALEAETSTHLLVPEGTGRLYVVEAEAAGVTRSNMNSIDRTRRYTELKFDNASGVPLSAENDPGMAADRMIAAGRVLLAARQPGCCPVYAGCCGCLCQGARTIWPGDWFFSGGEAFVRRNGGETGACAGRWSGMLPMRWNPAMRRGRSWPVSPNRISRRSARSSPVPQPKSTAAWGSPTLSACTIGSNASARTGNCSAVRRKCGNMRRKSRIW